MVFTDPPAVQVRQELKKFSDWPTYPQLYAAGEMLGGCDIILELAESGALRGEVSETLEQVRSFHLLSALPRAARCAARWPRPSSKCALVHSASEVAESGALHGEASHALGNTGYLSTIEI